MAAYELNLSALVEAKDDVDAKRIRGDLQKMLENPLIRGLLSSKSIQLKAPIKVGDPVKK